MADSRRLVSIGIPVRNGADRLEEAVRSVLAQDHERLEVVISDNASTDGTEELCRRLAREDPRVVYHRQPRNIGIVGNFTEALRLARGEFFRWMGDDDRLEPHCVSRSLEPLLTDERLILVTSDTAYTSPDGSVHRPAYQGAGMLSDDPVDRLEELWDAVTTEHMRLDPLYGVMRRAAVVGIRRPVMIREDEVYATVLALTGPWGHVPEVLAHRSLRWKRLPHIARALGVPVWTAHFANTLQFRAMYGALRAMDLTPEQRRRGRAVLARIYGRRQRQVLAHRGRKLTGLAVRLLGG
ncbi:glycosyltransferase family 2 protein [Microbispora bryophytorum]|uniref:glycosyltransferase family 2 protein n=1 Tax=Microbispora bryophytorum TaxID=1460882 RepID=UPI0033FE2B0F